LLKNWIKDERLANEQRKIVFVPSVSSESGIIIPDEPTLSRWERTSMKLRVSDEYKSVFSQFKNHFVNEMSELGDDTLSKEINVLDLLITNP
jgi:hypothetical protein